MLLLFNFVKFYKSIQHCKFMIVKNVKFEWLINYWITIAKIANLLGPGTWAAAVKSNNFAAGTLHAEISRPFRCVPAYLNPC